MIGRQFILAGRAVFTLVGKSSRFTFRVSRKDPDPGSRWPGSTYFVGLLTGPNNETDYQYLGILDPVTGYVRLTRRSRLALGSPSVRAIQWALPRLWAEASMPPAFGIFHAGRCGRCGRTLTVPESVATGFGPECAEVLGIPTTAVVGPNLALFGDSCVSPEPETAPELGYRPRTDGFGVQDGSALFEGDLYEMAEA